MIQKLILDDYIASGLLTLISTSNGPQVHFNMEIIHSFIYHRVIHHKIKFTRIEKKTKIGHNIHSYTISHTIVYLKLLNNNLSPNGKRKWGHENQEVYAKPFQICIIHFTVFSEL